MTATTDNALRKAAVLVRSMDAESSAALLSRLSPEESAALRQAIRELGEIEDSERSQAASEFRVARPTVTRREVAGVELHLGGNDTQILRMPTAAAGPAAPRANEPPGSPFGDLADADASALAAYLAGEQSQTIAVVLSYLPPRLAAEVLERSPAHMRVPVLDRLADMGEPDPDNLQVIATGLREWIAGQRRATERRSSRHQTIAAILGSASDDARDQLATSLAGQSRDWLPAAKLSTETASEPQTPAPAPPRVEVRFDDLATLSPIDLARVLRGVAPDQVVVALVGADDRLMQRIESQLSRAQRATLRRQIAKVGPARVREVEVAQRSIAGRASRLLAVGAISRPIRKSA
ncbi:Flagellar motor switch protein FliG [Pirellulimonas nuda]|uniref:Flagellar motor switch protein FliG n=1 Tax=Pirellulimonas nuda TaxID=2528009 RepID=A0A518D9W3_9BACT|nr:FliG C-terminal domain-containing protein [Pirellulimonas nuda]QDU88233.1 Flagellar motor switch protein FliG [Pirellulimonas nuda]